MEETKVHFKGQTILEAGEHDAILVNGNVYVALVNGIGQAAATQSSTTAAQIVDDAKKAATTPAPAVAPPVTTAAPAAKRTRAKAPAAAAPVTAPPVVTAPAVAGVDNTGLEIVPVDTHKDLQKDEMFLAKLQGEGIDPNKLWEVAVDSFAKPVGGKEEKLYVRFLEDQSVDYLRDGDTLFEYDASRVAAKA